MSRVRTASQEILTPNPGLRPLNPVATLIDLILQDQVRGGQRSCSPVGPRPSLGQVPVYMIGDTYPIVLLGWC